VNFFKIILLFFLIANCSNNETTKNNEIDILSKKSFKNILMQIHLAEADFQLNKLKNIEKAKSKLKERRSEIFEKNNTTSKIFNKTLDHYSKKPEDLEIIYTEIIEDLQNKKSTL
tara:strand:- start:4613 stop:4957 length:345 start_codon:yes stop_codon:yes gene_type:complete